jgi:hypothetical protein
MNREELETLIDNEDFMETCWLYEDREEYFSKDNLKQFIFETIIPRVLVELLDWQPTTSNDVIREKVKEQFNINL